MDRRVVAKIMATKAKILTPRLALVILFVFAVRLSPLLLTGRALAASQQQSGSVGIQATIPGAAPTQAPTINQPSNGQSFSNLPVTVAGLCQNGTLVEVLKNGVFAGSRECTNGSYSIQIDLFSGRNDLIVNDYDKLNQASPNSNTVTVNFNNSLPTTGPLLTITTQYAKRGTDPGILTWPITISGGVGPYAISVDWGDKTKLDLLSEQFPGDLTLQHDYTAAGVYNITIRVTDSTGEEAFLQVIGVGNGPIQQTTTKSNSGAVTIEKVVPWTGMGVLFALSFVTFWLGKRHQLQTIRVRLRKGQPPFG